MPKGVKTSSGRFARPLHNLTTTRVSKEVCYELSLARLTLVTVVDHHRQR